MVHTNTAYETDKAANYKDGYLVVGVLFDEVDGKKIRVRAIRLFQDYQSGVARSHFQYSGSLTTPSRKFFLDILDGFKIF